MTLRKPTCPIVRPWRPAPGLRPYEPAYWDAGFLGELCEEFTERGDELSDTYPGGRPSMGLVLDETYYMLDRAAIQLGLDDGNNNNNPKGQPS